MSSSSSSSFSTTQQVLLALAPKMSAILSLVGSTWIVIEVLTDKLKNSTVFHRLLLAMSFFDIVSSGAFFASTWPIPKDTEIIWAVGDENTCQVQGFLLQVGIASPIYNLCLAIYYMLVIQFGYTESRIRDQYEIIMHFMTAILAVLPAIIALQLDLYHNASVWCWMAPHANFGIQQEEVEDCNDDDNDGDCTTIIADEYQKGWHQGWIFYHIIIWACCFFAIASLVSVYQSIRTRELERGIKTRRGSLDVLIPPRRPRSRRSSKLRLSASIKNNVIDESSFTLYTQDSFVVDGSTSSSVVSSNQGNLFSRSLSWGSQKSQQQGFGGGGSIRGHFDIGNNNISNKSSSSSINNIEETVLSSPSSFRPLETPFQSIHETSMVNHHDDKTPSRNNHSKRKTQHGEHDSYEKQSATEGYRRQRLSFINPLSGRSSSLTGRINGLGGGAGAGGLNRQGSLPNAWSSRRLGLGVGSSNFIGSSREWFSQSRQERFRREWQEAKDAEAVIMAIAQIKSSTKLSEVATSYASRQVYEQALLYTVAFIVTYAFATINLIVQEATGKTYFTLMLLHVFFMPLQGALNFLVYRRQQFRKLQLQYPHLSWWKIFTRTWRWSFLGPPKPLLESMVDDERHYPSISEQFQTSPYPQPSPDVLAGAGDLPYVPIDKTNIATDGSSNKMIDRTPPAFFESTPYEEAPFDENDFDRVMQPPKSPYDDDYDIGLLNDIMADEEVNRAVDNYMSSYAEYPNLLTEEDNDLIVSPGSFPVIRPQHQEQESSSRYLSTDFFMNCGPADLTADSK